MCNFSYVLVYVCPNLVSIALINTMTISNVGEERIKLACIYTLCHSLLKETRAGSEAEAMRSTACGLSPVSCTGCCFTSNRLGSLTPIINQEHIPIDLTAGQSYGDIFSDEVFSS